MKKILKKMLLMGLMACAGAVIYPAAAGDEPKPAQLVIGSPEFIRQVIEAYIQITVEQFEALGQDVREKMIAAFIERNGGKADEAFGYVCCRKGFAWAVKPLLECGAIDVNDKHTYLCPSTFLLSAVMNSDIETISALIAHGAVVNEKSAYGETALMCAVNSAASQGNEEIVRLLVLAGADIAMVCTEGYRMVPIGETILDIAIKSNNIRCLQILIDGLRRLLIREYPDPNRGRVQIFGGHLSQFDGCDERRESLTQVFGEDIRLNIIRHLADSDCAHFVQTHCHLLAKAAIEGRNRGERERLFNRYLNSSLVRLVDRCTRVKYPLPVDIVQLLEVELRRGCVRPVPYTDSESLVMARLGVRQGTQAPACALVEQPVVCSGLESAQVASAVYSAVPAACAVVPCVDMSRAVASCADVPCAVEAYAEFTRRAVVRDDGFECSSKAACLAYDEYGEVNPAQAAARRAQNIADREIRATQDAEYQASLAEDQRNKELKGKGAAVVPASVYALIAGNVAGAAVTADEFGAMAADERGNVVAAEQVILAARVDEEPELTVEQRRQMMAQAAEKRLMELKKNEPKK